MYLRPIGLCSATPIYFVPSVHLRLQDGSSVNGGCPVYPVTHLSVLLQEEG